MSIPRHISYSTTFVMDHYRVMQTGQLCQCGAKHKGSYASEVFVVYFSTNNSRQSYSLPLREVLRRYHMFTGEKIPECKKYLPELETKVVLTEPTKPNIEVCSKCRETWLDPNRPALPAMMPVDWEDLPIEDKKEIANPRNKSKSLHARMKNKAKAMSMGDLLKTMGGKV